MKFLVFLLTLFSLIFVFLLCTKKYRNPFKLFLVFGKKGSGKSTYLIKQGLRYMRKGYSVYTNMSECRVDGFRLIDVQDIGEFVPPPRSVLLVDEVGMIWDNRNFKSFRPEVRDFFKLQRHYNVVCFLASQTFDIDKKLRDLTDGMYLCVGIAGVLSIARRITRKVVLTESVGDQESRISENLKFAPIWYWSLTWIPRYAKAFDSFSVPPKPYIVFNDIADGVKMLSARNARKVLLHLDQQSDLR